MTDERRVEVAMSLPINFPVSTDAMTFLFRHNKLKASEIFPTDEPGTWEIIAKTWNKLTPEYRPCTWCGNIMGDDTCSCSKDICVTCAHPNEEGC